MSDHVSAGVKRIQIGAHSFYIRKMGAFDAAKLFFDMQKEILGPLAESGGLSPTGDMAEKVSWEGLAKLSERVDGAKMDKFLHRLVDPAYVAIAPDGDESKQRRLDDSAIALFCDMWDLLQIAWEVALHNFGGFGTRFGSLFGKVSSPDRTQSLAP